MSKLTIKNIDKIKPFLVSDNYRIDRIVILPDEYRFHWARKVPFGSVEIVMVQLERNRYGSGYRLHVGSEAERYIDDKAIHSMSSFLQQTSELLDQYQ